MRIACHYSTLSTNRRLRLVVLLLGHHGLRGIACSSCRCGALRGRIIHRFARGSRVSCSSRSSSCAASSTCASTSSWFWWHCCCGCVKGQGPKWWLEKVANILAIDKTPRIKRAPPPPPRNATSHVRVRGACFKSLVLVLYIHTHALVALSNSHGGGGFFQKIFFPNHRGITTQVKQNDSATKKVSRQYLSGSTNPRKKRTSSVSSLRCPLKKDHPALSITVFFSRCLLGEE